ncbi:hypothetical protein OFM35_30545, partial [Escherichia coli]|nr:hypothetical protein [Escherichia coli]
MKAEDQHLTVSKLTSTTLQKAKRFQAAKGSSVLVPAIAFDLQFPERSSCLLGFFESSRLGTS